MMAIGERLSQQWTTRHQHIIAMWHTLGYSNDIRALWGRTF